MRPHLAWLHALFAIVFLACNPSAKKSEVRKDTIVKATDTVTRSATDTTAATDSISSDCPRDKSAPVIKKAIFPDARFALQADGRTGIETFTLNNGDQVTITQSGCEYFTLKFKLETAHYTADTADVSYWSNATLSFMREIKNGLDVPLDVTAALNKLSVRIQQDKTSSAKKLELGVEIDFGGQDPRQYLVIERVSRSAGQRFTVEVSLNYGPM